MNILLGPQPETITTLHLDTRLPSRVQGPCVCTCIFRIEPSPKGFVLHLEVRTEIHLCCQGCFEIHPYAYHNHTQLGLCANEQEASERLCDDETIVITPEGLPLETIVIDELHLYLPEIPHDCSNRAFNPSNAFSKS